MTGMQIRVPGHLLVWLLLLTAACSRDAQKDQPATEALPESAEVRRIAAELLGVPEPQIDMDVPLSRHRPPLDDLDLVELVMEVEDRFQIAIPDDELEREAGTAKVTLLADRLTLGSVANIVHRVLATPSH